MVIREEKPLSISEVNELLGEGEKAEKMKEFIKDLKILKLEDAKKLKDELKAMEILKLKDSHIVKIVDFVPKDASELNKVLSDLALDKEEVDKILNVTQNY